MLKEAVYHAMDSNYAYPLSMDTMVIRLRVKRGNIIRCKLFYGDRCYEEPKVVMESIDMHLSASDKLFDYFEVEFKTPWKRICYYFLLDDGKEKIYYYGDEFYDYVDENRNKYYQYAYIRSKDICTTPDWVRDAVIYQIFPDSFASGERKISGEKKDVSMKDGLISSSKLGGTLNGIKENISYLKELGINCLYLNPIFRAGAYHKYDTIDYYEIDPCFGTKEDFKALVNECHQAGIKVILDGVFNHTGVDFFAFQDVIKNAEKSRYKDWYIIESFPVEIKHKPNYESFAYTGYMPRTNTANPEVVDYFTGVGKYWIEEFHIDGWRLDVANEIDHSFWKEYRKAIKSVKPDAFLIAEIWEDCQSFVNGDEFDSAMNYKFTYACEDFFATQKINVSEFDNILNRLRIRYKKPVQASMMNFLDSHDVKRFLYSCGEEVNRLKLAVLFQMTYDGIPSIYYGDEVGISGFSEDEYRRTMIWNEGEQNKELLQYYKKLIKIRNNNIELRRGIVETIYTDNQNGVYGFNRSFANENTTIIINNSGYKQNIKIKSKCSNAVYKDILKNSPLEAEGGYLNVRLEPYSGKIIKQRILPD